MYPQPPHRGQAVCEGGPRGAQARRSGRNHLVADVWTPYLPAELLDDAISSIVILRPTLTLCALSIFPLHIRNRLVIVVKHKEHTETITTLLNLNPPLLPWFREFWKKLKTPMQDLEMDFTKN